MNPFYLFRAEAVDEPTNAELLIFDVIGNWDEIGEVSAKAFARDLSKLPSSVKRLDIHINSPGGSVFEASAIYSRLADHRSQKIVYVDGLAASAASIVAMVGHKIYIRANANMMIHLPSGLAIGNADDMRTMAGALDAVTEPMINIYASRTKLERDELRSMMAAETWFTPQQAVDKGFADEMRGVIKAAAVVAEHKAIFNGLEFDLSRFHNVPAFAADTTEGNTMPNKPKPKASATGAEETPEENGNGKGKEETPAPPATETPTPPATPHPQTPAPPPATADDPAAKIDPAVKAERDRVAALLSLDRPATHAIVMAAIKDGKSVVDIAAECMTAMDKQSTRDARHSDARQLEHIPPSDGADDDKKLGTLLSEKVQSRLKRRGGMRAHSRN
jgi:ATP-dependent protease ClpP protease subunit